jgi:hypothetical protein
MADEKQSDPNAAAEPYAEEPRGFGNHTRGLAGEYAHEQGWGLNEQERVKQPEEKQDLDGGTDYEYGARDFGDSPVDTSGVQPSPEAIESLTKDTEHSS